MLNCKSRIQYLMRFLMKWTELENNLKKQQKQIRLNNVFKINDICQHQLCEAYLINNFAAVY